ncbi:uncharacterized protein DUF4129 [Chitinophaga skermanii]|uniref:Uncharacterized protein DUF4129 n=1 Tax=Chitinophaga skermanii TaxID=331697 RepID=A0A327QCV1_9BACT|nr:DUF4129 domain-containing protein [Chitinophaga skermanii]RAJ01668.1 uncharacterized protein DUF4129 [Chitinophaga skermanii]
MKRIITIIIFPVVVLLFGITPVAHAQVIITDTTHYNRSEMQEESDVDTEDEELTREEQLRIENGPIAYDEYTFGERDTVFGFVDTYEKHEVNEFNLKELKTDPKMQYDQQIADLKKAAENREQSTWSFIDFIMRNKGVLSFIFYSLIFGVVALLVFLFLRTTNLAAYFGYRSKKITPENITEEVLHEVNFDELIKNAVAQKEWRNGVRYMFLQVLVMLGKQSYVVVTKDKTNREYLMEVAKQRFYKTFAGLTLQYEYVWYGHIDINESQFQQIQNDFQSFKNDLR